MPNTDGEGGDEKKKYFSPNFRSRKRKKYFRIFLNLLPKMVPGFIPGQLPDLFFYFNYDINPTYYSFLILDKHLFTFTLLLDVTYLLTYI